MFCVVGWAFAVYCALKGKVCCGVGCLPSVPVSFFRIAIGFFCWVGTGCLCSFLNVLYGLLVVFFCLLMFVFAVGWVLGIYFDLNNNACCGVGCLLFFLFSCIVCCLFFVGGGTGCICLCLRVLYLLGLLCEFFVV